MGVQKSEVAAPPTLRKIFESRVGLGLQGGAKFCSFYDGSEPVLMDSPIYPLIVGRCGESGGALKNLIVKNAHIKGDLSLIDKDSKRLWNYIKHCNGGIPAFNASLDAGNDVINGLHEDIAGGNPFAFVNLALNSLEAITKVNRTTTDAAIDFTNAAASGNFEAMPLDMINRLLKKLISEDCVTSEEGFTNYCSSVGIDENGTHTLESHINPGITETLKSCGLKEFGGFQGSFDGAYMFNPYLDRMIDENELTDLILITTNPYDPRIPVAPQSELQDHEYSSDTGLKFSEVHSEALHLVETRKDLNIHGIHLKWESDWTMSDKLTASPTMIDNIRYRGQVATENALPRILKNLGKKSTYNPEDVILPSLLTPAAA